MEVIQIEGGHRVTGEVSVEGAKNSALKLMAATIMAPGVTTLTNVPNIADVHVMGKVLKNIGARIEVVNEHELRIDTSDVDSWETPYHLVAQMRASTAVLGPLLSRFGRAIVAMPGGCNIGARSIDMHILGLEALGVEFSVKHGNIHATAPNGLVGNTVTLSFASVGATENAMLAACAAEGETVIMNAAREPEITELQTFLQTLGADVTGAGSATVRVRGKKLEPFRVGHRIMPDRIVSSTLLCACAAAGGDVELRAVEPRHFSTVLHSLSECGCDIMSNSSSVRLRSGGNLKAPMPVITGSYPGFPTDAQPLMLAACLKARGTSVFVENVFQNRFRFTEELQRLGARIHTEGRVAVVTGVEALHGAPTVATDLRGGAALIIAALSAEGETDILDSGHVERGYESFDERLAALGADIRLSEQ